jgi:hypothetical protein
VRTLREPFEDRRKAGCASLSRPTNYELRAFGFTDN